MALITLEGLTRMALTYDPILRVLPFANLMDVLATLDINLLEVVGKDKIVQFQRKGGLAKPYVAGALNMATEVGKPIERTLEVKTSYVALKDHNQNYNTKIVMNNNPAAEKVDNKTKKHPLEVLIINEKLKTIGEDIVDALEFATRDEADLSPMGMFDGVNTLIDNEVSSGAIATGKGNLKNTGPIVAPVDENDFTAWNQLVEFIRRFHSQLRKSFALKIPELCLFHVMDALSNKIKNKDAFATDVFLQHLKAVTNAGNMKIISHSSLGSGDRITAQALRNVDFGMNTKSDVQFVQVRTPYEDTNYTQFWTQWDAGMRIRSIHEKEFVINDGTPISTDMSGDYQ